MIRGVCVYKKNSDSKCAGALEHASRCLKNSTRWFTAATRLCLPCAGKRPPTRFACCPSLSKDSAAAGERVAHAKPLEKASELLDNCEPHGARWQASPRRPRPPQPRRRGPRLPLCTDTACRAARLRRLPSISARSSGTRAPGNG
jgi:hypothetical protein